MIHRPRNFALSLLLAIASASVSDADETTYSGAVTRHSASLEQVYERFGPGVIDGAPKYAQRSWYFLSQRLEERLGSMQLMSAWDSSGSTSQPPQTAVWTSLGPRSFSWLSPLRQPDGTVQYAQGLGDTGRIRSIAVHPSDSSILYIGSAQGGVWKSENHGEDWQPLTNNACSPAISTMIIDPLDSDRIYAGTGEYHYHTGFTQGCAILASDDGGASWRELPIDSFDGKNLSQLWIHRLLIDPQTHGAPTHRLFAATHAGLLLSEDGGSTFNSVLGPFGVTDVAAHPLVPERIFAGYPYGGGVFRSVDAGSTWEPVAVPAYDDIQRIVLAIASTDPNTIYVAMSARPGYQKDNPSMALRLLKSEDGGNQWTELRPTGLEPSDLPWCRFQCSYDLDIAVDPYDAARVYFGGVTLVRSLDGGVTWEQIAKEVHVDFHHIEFGPDGTIWLASDGGVYRSRDNGSSWEDRNASLSLTQFYPGISSTPATALRLLAGSQDNGTVLRDLGAPWLEPWLRVSGGDGGQTGISASDPSIFYTTNQWHPSTGSFNILRFRKGGLESTNVTPVNITESTGALFIPPFKVDPAQSNHLLLGTDRIFESRDSGASWSTVTFGLPPHSQFSALAFAPSNPEIAYAASTIQGRIFMRTGTWSEIPVPWSSNYIRDLEVSPSNPLHLVVAQANEYRVASTPNGGLSWTDHTGNLPFPFINAIAIDWSGVLPRAFAATDIGIFAADLGIDDWHDISLGLPTGAILDLIVDQASSNLVAATHGRGMYLRPLRDPPGSPLYLSRSRFHVAVEWQTPTGEKGGGRAQSLTSDTGLFWFFRESNVELIIKILDACQTFDRFWVFTAGLTNVRVTVSVTDLLTGVQKQYHNPLGEAFPTILDTEGFPTCHTRGVIQSMDTSNRPPPSEDEASDSMKLRDGRFRLAMNWEISDGTEGSGKAVALSNDTGYFWFFNPRNVESVVKVLDGCSVNSFYWVFATGLTNLQSTLEVVDTASGGRKAYTNPRGRAFQPIQDTEAFPCE